jgi:hypothetical protein
MKEPISIAIGPDGVAHEVVPTYKFKHDPYCICKGNWRNIVKKSEPLLNTKFEEVVSGKRYTFFGVVHGGDDYYYGMYSYHHGLRLLSCVGNLDTHGFKEVK